MTCVTWDRRRILAEVRAGRLHLTPAGRAAEASWFTIPDHFPGVTLDAFVVMPDHIHGLLRLDEAGDVGPGLPRRRWNGPGTAPRSLGAIVAGWKSAATKRIWAECPELSRRIWQRNYHEWVIRDGGWLEGVRRYIARNPVVWMANHGSG